MIGQSVRLKREIHADGFRRSYDDAPNITVYPQGLTGAIEESRLRQGKIEHSVRFDGSGKVIANLKEVDLEPIQDSERLFQSVLSVGNTQVQMDLRDAWSLINAHPGGPMSDDLNRLNEWVWNVEHNTEAVKIGESYVLRWKQERWW